MPHFLQGNKIWPVPLDKVNEKSSSSSPMTAIVPDVVGEYANDGRRGIPGDSQLVTLLKPKSPSHPEA